MPGPQAQRLRLTSKQRHGLQELTRSQTVEYRLRFRAKGLLLLADGQTVSAVARSLLTTRTTACGRRPSCSRRCSVARAIC